MGNNAAGTLGGAAGIASAVTPWAAPVLGVANIGMSLLEASKQADLQKSAERAAEQAFAEQKRIQGQNFFEALRVPMEQYNKQREAITAGGQQIMQAAQEAGSRETVGTAGKLFAGTTQAESDITDKAAQALFDIGKLQALEQGQTADDLAKMYGTRVAGAQIGSAAANKANIELQNKAIAAGGGVITGLTGMIDEYSKTNPTYNGYSSSGIGTDTTNSAFQSPISSQFGDVPNIISGNMPPTTQGAEQMPVGYNNPFSAVTGPKPYDKIMGSQEQDPFASLRYLMNNFK